MKDIYVGAPKTARNSLKIVIYESQILRITLYYTLATQTFEIVYQMSMQYIYHLPLQSHLRIYQFSLGQITITISIYFTVHYNSCQLLGPQLVYPVANTQILMNCVCIKSITKQ